MLHLHGLASVPSQLLTNLRFLEVYHTGNVILPALTSTTMSIFRKLWVTVTTATSQLLEARHGPRVLTQASHDSCFFRFANEIHDGVTQVHLHLAPTSNIYRSFSENDQAKVSTAL